MLVRSCWRSLHFIGRGHRMASVQPLVHVLTSTMHTNTLEGQTDHTLSLHHTAPRASNVPALLVQLLQCQQ